MEADFNLDRFFRDAKEDFNSKAISSDSPVHVTHGGSRHVKLKKVTDYKVIKEIICPKRKGHSKKRGSSVKPPTFAKKSSLKVKVKSPKAREKICDISTDHIQEQAYDSKALNNNSELLKSSPKDNKLSKKIKIKYHLDSNEDTDKVILDMTNRHLLADLENLINNNQTGELKTKMSSTKPPSENLPSTSRRKEFTSHTSPREWTKNQEMDQERGLEALSTWEEDAGHFPEMSREIILGVTMSCGELHFIVDWDGVRWKVRAEEAYRRIPMTCLKYYESLLVWNTS